MLIMVVSTVRWNPDALRIAIYDPEDAGWAWVFFIEKRFEVPWSPGISVFYSDEHTLGRAAYLCDTTHLS